MAQLHVLMVEGMGCEACVKAVEKAIAAVDASAHASIDLASGRVEIAESGVEAAVFARAITAAGYEAAPL